MLYCQLTCLVHFRLDNEANIVAFCKLTFDERLQSDPLVDGVLVEEDEEAAAAPPPAPSPGIALIARHRGRDELLVHLADHAQTAEHGPREADRAHIAALLKMFRLALF